MAGIAPRITATLTSQIGPDRWRLDAGEHGMFEGRAPALDLARKLTLDGWRGYVDIVGADCRPRFSIRVPISDRQWAMAKDGSWVTRADWERVTTLGRPQRAA